MPRLRRAWTEAWATLGSDVPQLTQRGGGPSRNVVRVLFPTVFGDARPPGLRLEARLRSQKTVFTEMVVDDVDVQAIERAVRLARPALVATAALFGELKTEARMRELSSDRVDAHLLRRAHEWVADGTVPEAAMIDTLMSELGDRPSPERLRAVLDASPQFVVDLEEELVGRWASSPTSGDERPDVTPYLDFLDDEGLDARSPDELSRQRWDEALGCEAETWQSRTAALGLSDTSPPARPAVRAASTEDQVRPHEWHPRWLDVSIEERVASALKREVTQRSRLPEMRELMTEEVRRASSPLGLAEHDSRTVLALGAVAAMHAGLPEEDEQSYGARVIGAGRASVRAADRVRNRFRFWRREQEEKRGVAGFPKVWSGILADPTTFYLSYLWLRIHHDELYGRPTYTAETARRAVVTIADTVTDRLTTLPASRPRTAGKGDDDPDDATVEIHRGRAVALYFEVDRIRAGVDSDEFERFFASVGTDPVAERARWNEWTAAADSGLALDDVLDWLDDSSPG